MRSQYLTGLIGKPWLANSSGPESFDCWHLAREVEKTLFAIELPDIKVPDHPSWAWMIVAFDRHPERNNWIEVEPDAMGIVTAADGALVLMARTDRPAHIGVWLAAERGIIHCDQGAGVMFESLSTLRAKGWRKLKFYQTKAWPQP